jgi:P-type Cu+ transporter
MSSAALNEPTATSNPGVTGFSVAGMSCNNCARHVTEAIQAVPGVDHVAVQLESGRATVHWRPETVPAVGPVVEAVRRAGYQARPLEEAGANAGPPSASPLVGWKFNVIFGAVLTLPLMIGDWVLGLGTHDAFKWLGFACAAPVVLVCGRRFFVGAWRQIQRGRSNMDTLVALGSTTAFGFSTWGLLAGWPGHLYFMEAAAIITLISLGHWLEALASDRAASSLRALMRLTPQTARRLDPAAQEVEVPVAELRPGDRIVLRPGDRVATDGEVAEGRSAVDESMLTGESLPSEKAPGARLYGGTVNSDGRLVMRVTATGEGTALAQIIAVVRRAQASRAGIQKLADRVSNVFVPIVVVVAVATALWWGLAYPSALGFAQALASVLWHAHFPDTALAAAFIHAAAVLIVACPCAMGLATPAAIMAGTNAAARRGILIRDGQALEKSGTITTLVFDKTGTLTQGRLSVAAFEEFALPDPSAPSAKRVAALLAQPSNHPVSRALAHLATPGIASDGPGGERRPASASRPAPFATLRAVASTSLFPGLEDWREVRGCGIESKLATEPAAVFRVGSLTWLNECGVDPAPAKSFLAGWSMKGATVLGVAADRRLIGVAALRDELKPRAVDVVAQLVAQGYSVGLITGDQRGTARAIAQSVGIPEAKVFAEVRPESKADMIRQLQQRGERVAFVGDGLNDAPALEQADLGIAVSRASDVAKEAADILLLKSDIQAIPEALGLAQATLRTIRQNLFWAFFYNAAAIPLAAFGFLSPVLCALAMGASDLIVIGNALRLLRWKPRRDGR